jgi:hypothetical protein
MIKEMFNMVIHEMTNVDKNVCIVFFLVVSVVLSEYLILLPQFYNFGLFEVFLCGLWFLSLFYFLKKKDEMSKKDYYKLVMTCLTDDEKNEIRGCIEGINVLQISGSESRVKQRLENIKTLNIFYDKIIERDSILACSVKKDFINYFKKHDRI